MPLLKQFLHRKFNGISRSAFRRGFYGFERRSKKHIAKIWGFHEGNLIRISYDLFVENSNKIWIFSALAGQQLVLRDRSTLEVL